MSAEDVVFNITVVIIVFSIGHDYFRQANRMPFG